MKKKVFLILNLLVLSLATSIVLYGQATAPQKPTVGILIFDDAQIIDFAGPYEVFMGAGYNVVTIAPEKKLITSIGKMKVMPDYDFSDTPKLDILVISGGGKMGTAADLEGAWKNAPLPVKTSPEMIEWIKKKSDEAQYVLSVCNGAFLLARAGLLDNQTAVTTMPFLTRLKEVSPTTTVAFDKRWADNGKIVTSGGISAGIDAALRVVEKMKGKGDAVKGHGEAQRLALGMEYRWNDTGTYSAYALAQKYTMFGFDIDGSSLSREGDENRWENRWLVSRPSTVEGIVEAANKSLSEQTTYGPVKIKWTREESSAPKPNFSVWSFADEKGRAWIGRVSVEPASTEKDKFILSVKAARKDTTYAADLK